MHAVLQDQPLPARLAPWPAATITPMARCVLLAMLLHLWLVLMLGNAPGGTAPPGQGVFGAINITLRGPMSDSARDAAPAATPTPGAAPESDSPRWGGRVRQTELPPDSLPGAERLGVPAPQVPQALPAPTPPALPMPAPLAPPGDMTTTLPMTLPQAPQAAQPPIPTPELVPAPLLAPLPAAALPTPPLAAAAPVATLAPAERTLATPLLPPTRSGGPALAREPVAAALPELQALPTPGAPPAGVRQLPAAPVPAAPRAAEAALPRGDRAETVALPSVPAVPSPGTLAQTPGLAGPDAGSRVGHDVATPAASAASQPPRLNLELARPRGGELSRFATGGALPVLPRPPEVDEKLARDIEKSGKTDCRKAYAGAGVLAVLPLMADAVRSGGCKW